MEGGATTITPELEAKLKNLLERVKKIYKLEPENEWISSEDKEGISIHTKKDKDTGMDLVRGEGPIPLTPLEIKDILIYDDPAALEYDKTKGEGKLVENIGDKYFFFYSKTKPPGLMISTRDVSILITFETDADGIVYVYGCSTPHAKMPETKGSVRAEVILWAWVITPVKDSPNKSNVVYMLQNDAKGYLPKTVVNKFVKDQASSVYLLRKLVETRQAKKN